MWRLYDSFTRFCNSIYILQHFPMSQEILPGVFFESKSNLALPDEAIDAFNELPTDALLFEVDHLKNSLKHLARSNDEMEKLVEQDKELAQYIVDNIHYMAQIRLKINTMEDILKSRA
eukprot:NODE_430_length_7576_cov_0.738665.p7 type:complete len:118 gc:universal NODE_430_length_7576_cov_0.738665:6333-6686(+)